MDCAGLWQRHKHGYRPICHPNTLHSAGRRWRGDRSDRLRATRRRSRRRRAPARSGCAGGQVRTAGTGRPIAVPDVLRITAVAGIGTQRAVPHRVDPLVVPIRQTDQTAGILQNQVRLPLIENQDGARAQHRPARDAVDGPTGPARLQPPAAHVQRPPRRVEKLDPLIRRVGLPIAIPIHRFGRGQHLVDRHLRAGRRRRWSNGGQRGGQRCPGIG
jgi:hypothetical protein